jgi:multidrug efflux pump subunit AcrA (membrane-fusion protein)
MYFSQSVATIPFFGGFENDFLKKPSSPVSTAATDRIFGEIRDIGLFSGLLYMASRFLIAPKIAGRLEKILVNIGDFVGGGHLVAVLDSDEYRRQVVEAQAGKAACFSGAASTHREACR